MTADGGQPLMDMTGSCSLCSWRSVPLPESTAKAIAVYHVIAEHPAEYSRVTSKAAGPLTGMQLWELTAFSQPAEN